MTLSTFMLRLILGLQAYARVVDKTPEAAQKKKCQKRNFVFIFITRTEED